MSNTVTINQSILDELENQCERQSTKNYRGVEVDYRTLRALIAEIKRSRLVAERFSCESGLIVNL